MEIIHANQITKDYVVGKVVTPVLRPMDFHIQEGEYIGIVGPSGSGKTTLLYVLSGLEQPTTGTVYYNSTNITEKKEDFRISLRQSYLGFIFQFYNLIHNLTVEENIQLAKVISPKKDSLEIDHVLEWVGMKDYKHYYPHQLSGGMQQRVAIARALVNRPKVIFADEPTGNLDSKNGQDIMELFRRLHHEEGVGIVLVTHSFENLKDCTRIIQLKDGQIVSHE